MSYESVRQQWLVGPEEFWAEAAEGIDWVWEHLTILECALAEYLKYANA